MWFSAPVTRGAVHPEEVPPPGPAVASEQDDDGVSTRAFGARQEEEGLQQRRRQGQEGYSSSSLAPLGDGDADVDASSSSPSSRLVGSAAAGGVGGGADLSNAKGGGVGGGASASVDRPAAEEAAARSSPASSNSASDGSFKTHSSPTSVGGLGGDGAAAGGRGGGQEEQGGGGEGRLGLIRSMAQDNPYFSAGAGLMGIGVVLTAVRRLGTLGATFAQRRMLVTLEIPSKDRSYPWFLEWMAQHSPAAAGVAEEVSVASSSSSSAKGKAPATSPPPAATAPASRGWFGIGSSGAVRSHQLAVETSYKQHENGASEALFSLVPGPGTHYFRYKGAWMQVKRERDSKLMDLHSGVPWETVTLTALSRDRELFPLLLAEARALADKGNEGKTVVYTAWGAEWRPFGKPRRKRDLRSVVLGDGVAERVEQDLRAFLGRGKWYAERGIPYRRGYLLHGPPGSGKTSFIQALAGALSYNICLLNLSERGLTDDKLNHLLGLAPERSFILLEDVDAAFNRRVQTSEDGYKSSVTFSGLLNALDGVASAEERVIFMTTNHFDRLDPALVRPGRVDLKELLDDAAPEQAHRLFLRFYGVDERERAEMLEGIVRDQADQGRRISMAALQGHFIRHDVERALDGIDELFVAREAPPSEARGKGNYEVPIQE